MTCDHAVEQMSGALDGELSPEERQALEEHLTACPECQALWDELQGLEDLMADASLEVPEGFHASVMAAVADCPVPCAPASRKRPGWKAWIGLAAVAAIAVLAVGPGLLPSVGMGGAAGNGNAQAPAVVSNEASQDTAVKDGRAAADSMPEETGGVTDGGGSSEKSTGEADGETDRTNQESFSGAAPFSVDGAAPEDAPDSDAESGDTHSRAEETEAPEMDAPGLGESRAEAPEETGSETENAGEETPTETGTASDELPAVNEMMPPLDSCQYTAILSVSGDLPEGYAWSEDGTLEVDGRTVEALLAALEEAGVSYIWERGTPADAVSGTVLLIQAESGQ